MSAQERRRADGTAKEPRQLRRAFQSLIRAFGLLDADRTPCGRALPVSQAHALLELAEQPGMTQNRLAHTLGLTKSAVSRLVERMKGAGLITRRSDRADRRARQLTLTAKGGRLAAEVDADSLKRFHDVLAGVPPARRAHVIQCLELLREAVPVRRRAEET